MVQIRIQSPLDQPLGNHRLFDELKSGLSEHVFNHFRLIVAFAKVGPLLRLEEFLDAWIQRGGSIEAIFGIDERGTSIEALEFALSKFTTVHIAHIQAGAFNPTFHPKIYHFKGSEQSRLIIGSNNLTVGGTETNSESNICLDFTTDNSDDDLSAQAENIWQQSLSVSKPLDKTLLAELEEAGLIISEKVMRSNRKLAKVSTEPASSAQSAKVQFPVIKIIPPSPVPKKVIAPTNGNEKADPIVTLAENSTESFVIQIIPHQNGEILLSKTAVDQNMDFFGFPFTGNTIPKQANNPSYPQRTPDPLVNINVYSDQGQNSLQVTRHPLNTVFYAPKSEIRITVPPAVIQLSNPYSILVMTRGEDEIDYTLDIYNPGSEQYDSYLAVCNQTMPSGGNETPRKFGWL